MSDTITLKLRCCDDALDGKLADIEYTYVEAGIGYMGGWCSARAELDAVYVDGVDCLERLDEEDLKLLAKRVLEAIEEGWVEDLV